MTIRPLKLEPATAQSTAAFGELVGTVGTSRPSAFYDGAVTMFRPADGFVSDADAEVAVARINRRPMQVRYLERHFKHTQMFIPLGGKPFVAVLAPPTEGDMPDIDEARAFLFDGSAGFSMHLRTWHEFPFAVIDGTEVIVVLRREATKGLMKDAIVNGEGVSPDLDKKDIARRLGVTLEVQWS